MKAPRFLDVAAGGCVNCTLIAIGISTQGRRGCMADLDIAGYV
jgi:hypothetical protein